MASSMSNSFALLGGEDGFQQVPSKRNKKKKSKALGTQQANESPANASSAPSEVSEHRAGASSEIFQQVWIYRLCADMSGNDALFSFNHHDVAVLHAIPHIRYRWSACRSRLEGPKVTRSREHSQTL